MTKELEALKRMHQRAMKCEQNTNIQETSDYIKLEQALTPPTQEEVCKVLSEYMNEPVWFDENNDIRISAQWLVKKINTYGLNFMIVLPPHLITMISRFFERSGDKCTNK